MGIQIYTGEWVLPIAAPPIRSGAVAFEDDRITYVGAEADLELRPELRGRDKVNFGLAAILPGFVNVHSHLELAVLRGALESFSFRDWILAVTKARAERLTGAVLASSAQLGAVEAIRAGITTIADTGDTRAPFDALRQSGLRGIAYREVFGPDPDSAHDSLDGLRAKVEDIRAEQTSLVRVGVSPHAPYTVSANLFQRVADWAATENLDICIHTAESEAERQLMLTGVGDFAVGLRQRGIKWRPPAISTIKYFERLGVLATAPLLIHCVNVDDQDISLMASRGARVAHCPKSNAKLGHGIAPLTPMLESNITVGLGTDGVASNNRCDMIEEARFCGLIHRAQSKSFQLLTPERLLRLATIDGARALGMGAEIGSLEVGKQADLIAIDLSQTHNLPVHDPYAAIIFSAAASDVMYAVVAGKVLLDGGRVKTLDEAELRHAANNALQALQ